MKDNQFVSDTEDMFEVEAYHGRYMWFGPAIRADNERELQDVIRATQDYVQWDSLGMGYIVYPVQGDREWYDANMDIGDEDEDDEDE